jgi:hypothetical protein
MTWPGKAWPAASVADHASIRDSAARETKPSIAQLDPPHIIYATGLGLAYSPQSRPNPNAALFLENALNQAQKC